VGKLVSNSKRQSDTLTEDHISKFLEEEDESDVNSEASDDFSFYNGVQAAPCVQVLSHRWEFKQLKKS
jgi:hypothetical protein